MLGCLRVVKACKWYPETFANVVMLHLKKIKEQKSDYFVLYLPKLGIKDGIWSVTVQVFTDLLDELLGKSMLCPKSQ